MRSPFQRGKMHLINDTKSQQNQFRIFKPSKEHFSGSADFPNQHLRQIGQRIYKL